MDIKQLQYFLAIVECGTYARASELVGITQSALTQSVVRLEESLDTRLFERGRFGAQLTEAGRMLLPRARLIAAEARLARAEVRHSRGAGRTRITVGVGKSIGGDLLSKCVSRIRLEYPDVSLSLMEGWSPELFGRLQNGQLDFVLSAPVQHLTLDLDLSQAAVYVQTESVLVGRSHPLARAPRVTVADLAQYPWLMPPQGNGRIRYLQRVFQDAGVELPSSMIKSDCIPLGIQQLKSGEIVSLSIMEVVESYLAPHEYKCLPIPELTFERPVYLTFRRRGRLQTPSAAFAQLIREVGGDLPQPGQAIETTGGEANRRREAMDA